MEITTYSRANITTGRTISEADYMSFIAWIDRTGATTRTYLTNLRQWAAWMSYKGIDRPTAQDVRDFRDYLQKPHAAIKYDPKTGWAYQADKTGRPIMKECKPSTVRMYLKSVRQFFSWTAAEGIYPNIADGVRMPKADNSHKKDALTIDQVREVRDAVEAAGNDKIMQAQGAGKDREGRTQRAIEQEAREKAMYLLMVTAGLRDVEINRANVRDIAFNGKSGAWLYVYGKGREEADQKKAIAPCAADAIRDYLDVRADGAPKDAPLFVSTGNRSGGQRIATTTISKMMKGAMKKAGIDDSRKTAHSLRHTAAAMMMDATHDDIYAVRDYMRHASIKTTEIYLDRENAEQDQKMALIYDQMING